MFEAEIATGVAFLDNIAPDWYDRIDLSTLDVNRPLNCVLSQVEPHGDDYDAWEFSMGADWVCAHGFSIPLGFHVPEEEVNRQFDILTEEWRAVVLECRAA